MRDLQSWCTLPDSIKRQAAPDMLAGKTWMHWGKRIEHPGETELRQWASNAPEQPQKPSNRILKTNTVRNVSSEPKTIREKREVVARALAEHPELSNRELARRLGVSHTFIAMSRRKQVGNVAVAW